jgi:putative oxidoreductase
MTISGRTVAPPNEHSREEEQRPPIAIIVLVGRVLFAPIFIISLPVHFQAGTVALAKSAGVPFSSLLVPVAGLIAFPGGLSVAFGFRTRYGACLLVLFLVPVTFFMHRFWGLSEPQMAMMQQVNLMKNVSMLGGAILNAYFGGGPLSIDSKKRRQPSSCRGQNC